MCNLHANTQPHRSKYAQKRVIRYTLYPSIHFANVLDYTCVRRYVNTPVFYLFSDCLCYTQYASTS